MNFDEKKRLEMRSIDLIKEPLIDENLTKISFDEISTNLTIDKAIEPLKDFFPNLSNFLQLIKEKCSKLNNDLTFDQSAAIMLYTIDSEPIEECFQYVLNETLRRKDSKKLQRWILYLDLFFRGISRLKTVSKRIYRPCLIDLTEKYPLHRRFTWWSFSLCRLSMENDHLWKNSNEKRTLFRIDCQSAKDISQYTFYSTNDQILLLDGSQFQVISSIKIDENQQQIDLKEISTSNASIFKRRLSIDSSILLSPEQLIDSTKSKFESIDKFIHRTVKLQEKIDHYRLNSSIDLTNEQLDDQDISFIVQHAIVKKQCSILRLDNNRLTYKATTILAPVLENNQTLMGLNLSSNLLFDKGIVPFVKILSMNYSVLKKLHLGSNRISNEGALLLSNILQTNRTLTVLWLDSNRIGNEGTHYLTDVLIHHNRTLEEFSLKNNRLINSLSCPFFIELIQTNSILIEIDISYCSLTKKENETLIQMARQHPQLLLKADGEPDECIIV